MRETSPSLDVAVSAPVWRNALEDVEDVCRHAALAALVAGAEGWDEGPPLERMEVSLVLSDDAGVRTLNRDYRGQDKATNVLSFAALDDEDAPVPDDGPVLLGDVIVAFETVDAEARSEGKTLKDHLSHLVVHGVLHLMGFDHEDDREAALMEAMECRVLAGLGIAAPYDDEREAGDE